MRTVLPKCDGLLTVTVLTGVIAAVSTVFHNTGGTCCSTNYAEFFFHFPNSTFFFHFPNSALLFFACMPLKLLNDVFFKKKVLYKCFKKSY